MLTAAFERVVPELLEGRVDQRDSSALMDRVRSPASTSPWPASTASNASRATDSGAVLGRVGHRGHVGVDEAGVHGDHQGALVVQFEADAVGQGPFRRLGDASRGRRLPPGCRCRRWLRPVTSCRPGISGISARQDGFPRSGAEGVGFEPTVTLPSQWFSRPSPSATRRALLCPTAYGNPERDVSRRGQASPSPTSAARARYASAVSALSSSRSTSAPSSRCGS